MASVKASATRNRLKAIVEGVANFDAARTFVGYVTQTKDSDDTHPFKELVSSGHHVYIKPADFNSWSIYGNGSFSVDIEILFGFAKTANYTFTAIEDDIEAVLDALVLESNWSAISDAAAPIGIDVETPEFERLQAPVIGKYVIRCTFSRYLCR